jgi:DHA1 family inner membrane transport protein
VSRTLFGSLCGLVFVINFGRTVFAPLVEEFQTAFGVGPATLGSVTALVWIGSALPRIPLGYLLTHISRERLVIIAGAALSVTAALTATATSVQYLQIGAFTIGLASGAYFVSAIPLLGDLRPTAVGRTIGIHGTAAQVAAVTAAPVVILTLQIGTWRIVFWGLSLCAAAITIIFAVQSRNRTETIGQGPDQDFQSVVTHWRIIGIGLVMITGAGFIWQGLFNFYVSYLVDSKLVTQATAGGLLTVSFAAGVPAFWASGRLVDRFQTIPYIISLLSLFVISVTSFIFTQHLLVIIGSSVGIGFAIHGLFPALDTWLLSVLPSDIRASAYAVFSGISLFLEALGSGTVGLLRDQGLSFDLIFSALIIVLGLTVCVITVGYLYDRIPTPEQ